MNEERMKVLEMLAAGKITVAEADSLLGAIGKAPAPSEKAATIKSPKFLRVLVESNSKGEQTVNVRVPFQLLRSGVRLAALLPAGIHDKVNEVLREQGVNIDLNRLKPDDLESLVNDLAELTVDVDNGTERVKVFCE